MGAPAEQTEHPLGICCIMRLAQDGLIDNHDGVSTDEKVIRAQRHSIGLGFLCGNVASNLHRTQPVGITLGDAINHPYLKGQPQSCQQLTTAR